MGTVLFLIKASVEAYPYGTGNDVKDTYARTEVLGSNLGLP